MPHAPAILLTAFEPSGDTLGAALARKLRELRPDVTLHGFGGPRMRDAGVDVIEDTTQHAVMLAGALGQVREHTRRVGVLKQWLRGHEIRAFVPIDSPAANWSICKLVRTRSPRARIVHLVAPQLWAWATWRIRKMRRLSDHALCLLPFEPAWFESRGVPASFVGHPLFEPGAIAPHEPDNAPSWPAGSPKLALLPGSRPGEWAKNWRVMLDVWAQLKHKHPSLSASVAAVNADAEKKLREMFEHWLRAVPSPDRAMFASSLDFRAAQADAVLAWADVVLVVSGTATLQVAAHGKPMIPVYNMSWLQWQLVGQWIVHTRTFTLPNLIAEHIKIPRVLPEFIPHFGAVPPLVEAVDELFGDSAAAVKQREGLARVCAAFEGGRFSDLAAERFLAIAGL